MPTDNLTIICTQENFSRGLQAVSRVATTKSSLPILANIHLQAEKGQIKLSATDLEIGVTTTIGAKVGKTGAITLPARLLVDFVANNTDQTLAIHLEGTEAKLQSDRYSAVMKGMDATEFPLIPSPGKDETTHLSAALLKRALSSVLFATALDDARPVLNGIFCRFEGSELRVAATDSYRLAERRVTLPSAVKHATQLILPARAAAEIVRVLPDADDVMVRVAVSTSQFALEFDSTVVVSRLIEGNYPDYRQIIPTTASTTARARRDEVLAAVRMASLFARDVAHQVRFVLKPGSDFAIRAVSSVIGHNTAAVTAEVEGEPLEIAFNAKFLLDALSNTPGELVTLHFLGADRPVVARGQGDDAYLNLVMPLRLDA